MGEVGVKRNLLIGGAALLLAGLCAIGCYQWFHGGTTSLTLPGIVEIQEVRLGSKVGGRVAKVHVMEGDMVEPGQAIVTFETPELEKQILQQQARVAQLEQDWKKAEYGPRTEEIAAARAAAGAARARMDRMEVGYRDEEKKQARYDMNSAEAEFKQAQEDLERATLLYGQKAATKAELDSARAAHDRTRGRYHSTKSYFEMLESGYRSEDKLAARREWEQAQANLDLLLAGTRIEEKLSAKAKYEEAVGKLEELEVNLKERTIYAPEKAFVEVISVRQGDLVPANQPVVRVLRAVDMWIKVYVPETKVSMVKHGIEVEVRIDAYPDRVFSGKVVQTGTISEFTPRNVQSVDERRYQVFPIKVQVENPRGVFKAGLAAQVTLPLEGPP
jgi:multidrug resistance efflux pump